MATCQVRWLGTKDDHLNQITMINRAVALGKPMDRRACAIPYEGTTPLALL